MPIEAGSSNIRNIMAALNIKEVWAGGIQRFGPLVTPPGTTLTVVNVQEALVAGATTTTFNINASALLENDMGFICMRTDAVDPLTLSCPSFPTAFEIVIQRTGPSSDRATIFKFTVPAGMAGNPSVAITIGASGTEYIDAIFVRGKGNMTTYSTSSGVNAASLSIPPLGIPTGNGDSLLIACCTSTGAAATSITSYNSTPLSPTAGVTVPKMGLVSWVVITDTPEPVSISNVPSGTNQMLLGGWLN